MDVEKWAAEVDLDHEILGSFPTTTEDFSKEPAVLKFASETISCVNCTSVRMSVLSCHLKTNKLLDTCLSAYFYALNFVLVGLIAGLRR